MLIVSHASFYDLGSWWSEIESFLASGGRALISTFDLDGSNSEPTTLWNTIGLGPRGDITSASPVYWWDAAHPLFHQPESVPQLSQMIDLYFDDGDRAGVLAGAGDRAGFTPLRVTDQGAIVVSADRRAIVNSHARNGPRSGR